MKKQQYKIIATIVFSLIFYFSRTDISYSKEIGEICTNKSECTSGDCGESNNFDTNGIAIRYCDCQVGPNSKSCNIYSSKDDYNKWACIKANQSEIDHKLNYCKNSLGKIFYPVDSNFQPTPKPDFTIPKDISVAGINLVSEITLFKPVMQVKLPQASFSDVEDTITEEYDGTYIHIPWVGQYIKAIYNWSMVIVSIVAVVMIILQAARIVTSAGGEAKMNAYKKIAQVVIGLIIMWSSYFILYTINPALVEFKALRIKYMPPETVEPDAD